MPSIIFTNTFGVPEEYRPIPASNDIPDWYKNLESYINGEKRPVGDGNRAMTAKRCMPIFDAMIGGYLILTHTDIFVSQKIDEQTGKEEPYYEWSSYGAIEFHSKIQLPEHPEGSGHAVSYPKWINTWSIKTPPGYSCLFVAPLHRETPMLALPGVVDTDTYTAPVNFPFVLKNPKMEGLIPAGTPIVQVIPFQREEWKMELGTNETFEEQKHVTNKLRVKFFDSYKTQFRKVKTYR